MRRFRRAPAQLQVETECGGQIVSEIVEEIGRNGFRLRTQREVFPDTVERYRSLLPSPLQAVCVDGQVVSRVTTPGDACMTAGIRIQLFVEGQESSWIRLVEELLRSWPGSTASLSSESIRRRCVLRIRRAAVRRPPGPALRC